MRTLSLVALCLALAGLSGEAAGVRAAASGDDRPAEADAACRCPDPFAPGTPPGVVWQGPTPAPDLPALARLLAPALWFSSDEPLLVFRRESIPQPHPCDRSADRAVVYYQATQIVLRSGERVEGTGESDPRFFDKVDHFVLKYFFYYDEDRGLSPHPHDLEAVTMLVYLERAGTNCVRVRVARVEGLAHGLDWYSNILRVERDTVFPVMVLVEEGKHASVPDRNADGVYTPGYDVNARVNDAWGLRDVLGSSRLLGARYSASMSKPRVDAFRLLPPEDAPLCTEHRRGRGDTDRALGRYELRAATAVPVCQPADPESRRLLEMMRYHRFGSQWPADQYESDLARELSDPENAFRWVSAVNARFESRRAGASIQGPGFDLREVWLVPRAHVVGRGWAVEGLVTPSASRWVDWYAAVGYERGLANTPDDAARDGARTVSGFGGELGLKFRVAAPGRTRWAVLGYRFGGLRLGLRASGFWRLREPRVIVEIGAGAF
jgi:hypothetical protein